MHLYITNIKNIICGRENMKIKMKQKGLLLDYTGVVVNVFIISMVLALAILATNTASAVGSETISIGSATMDKDSTTVLQLSIANAVEITGLSLDINYDPAVVEVQDISVNEDVTGSTVTSNIDNTAGKISIVIINTDMINSVESVPLIDIAVHAIGEAGNETPLSLQNVEISDLTFSSITVESIVNGSVKINNGNLVLSDTVGSDIDQPKPATPGFGWVLTILNLLFMIKIFRYK